MHELIKFGRKIVQQGLTGSFFGNVSAREGEQLWISTTGSMLDELEHDLVQIHVKDPGPDDSRASSDLILHRAVYAGTAARYVFHGHAPYSVVLSLLHSAGDRLRPDDMESRHMLKGIPVLDGDASRAELAPVLAETLADTPAAIVRGHGVFSRGADPVETFASLCAVEHACRVQYLVGMRNALDSAAHRA